MFVPVCDCLWLAFPVFGSLSLSVAVYRCLWLFVAVVTLLSVADCGFLKLSLSFSG
jgi:hypothetical protein